MANPIYHDDPGFYERPGTEVPLIVDVKPTVFAAPGLPWKCERIPRPQYFVEVSGVVTQTDGERCRVCKRATEVWPSGLCSFCSRAQAQDETHLARTRQPQTSGPRITSLREGWER